MKVRSDTLSITWKLFSLVINSTLWLNKLAYAWKPVRYLLYLSLGKSIIGTFREFLKYLPQCVDDTNFNKDIQLNNDSLEIQFRAVIINLSNLDYSFPY